MKLTNTEKSFFEGLYGDHLKTHKHFLEVRCINGKKTHTLFLKGLNELKQLERELEGFQAKGFHIFFGVNPRSRKKGSGDSVKFVVALKADLDFKKINGGRNAALRLIKEFPHPPSAIVESGNGLHLYWFFKKPLILENDEDQRRVEAIGHIGVCFLRLVDLGSKSG